jgi:type I restriction enzyme R subunit
LELFGTRPDPARKPAPDNVPEPFHVYTMRQAIEEEFILDVLQNYMSYRLAFKLTHHGKEWDDKQVERSAAMRGIMGWVRLHPYNIAQKVEVVVEHYRQFVAPLLGGRAKGMVVVASRREAVRWKVTIDKYVADHGYPVRTLVAFSGEVTDDVTGPDPVTEASSRMNPDLRGRDIREAFGTDEYQLLLVANKFQTGFDQPLLCGMYVDKKLAGIQAVQTLSRLNRAFPGKETTYVLDFVSDAEEVLAAFRTYHKTAQLAGVTDPYLVQNLKERLDGAGHYDDPEVNRVVEAFMRPTVRQAELTAAVTPVADRVLKRYRDARDRQRTALEHDDQRTADEARAEAETIVLFRDNLANYVRLYTFLSQIIDYQNTDVEKRSIFYRVLLPTLQLDRGRPIIDLSQVLLTHHNLRSRGRQTMPLGTDAGSKLAPLTDTGTGKVQEKEKARLAEIIEKVNDLFDGDLSPQDKLVYVNDVLKGKLLESETLQQQAANNTKEQFAHSPDLTAGILSAVMCALDAHTAMSSQALGSEAIREGLKDVLLHHAELWESLRAEAR